MLKKNFMSKIFSLAIISYLIEITISQTQKTTYDSDFTTKLSLKHLKEGDNKTFAMTGDNVTVHYNGTFPATGVSFDSSYARDQPYSFYTNFGRVIKCWDETVMRMSLGEKVSVVCPYDMAYGENGNGNNIPAKADLAFDIDLLCIANNCADAKAKVETVFLANDTMTWANSGRYLRLNNFLKFGLFFLISLILA